MLGAAGSFNPHSFKGSDFQTTAFNPFKRSLERNNCFIEVM
jgi:hypothetical protein